jgi:hypothetical protein
VDALADTVLGGLLGRIAWAVVRIFPEQRGGERSASPGSSVLVFSKTAEYRHPSIPDGVAAVERLGRENGFAVEATEGTVRFTDEDLRRYGAVVFLNTTGDVLNAE